MIKKIFLALLIIFGIAQFFNPEKNESTELLSSDLVVTEKPNDRIKAMLHNACYDCHSNHTNYPWYDRITPVNFWVQGHVDHGKGELNFSLWSTFSPKKKIHKLEECIELIEKGEMPLESYTIMHGDAKFDETEKKELLNWLQLVKIKHETTNLPM
ncbi:heme-binding domain-containing protein [Pseudofulvibacter geojedonensis]|uniref:Heme-binding domain-containing protein n=1 Tax=Pseudofulvibacter geojedonensis TaxID=1123758 RepID=A0ABW3HZH7_9FLAO